MPFRKSQYLDQSLANNIIKQRFFQEKGRNAEHRDQILEIVIKLMAIMFLRS
jgi:hypothetical protein